MQSKTISLGFISLLLCSLAFADTVKHVQSLGEVPKAIKSKKGLEQYREQMSGTPKPDGFGTSLPPGLTAKEIVALIAPGQDTSLATLVGAKAWPYRPGSFVAIACFASSKQEYDDDIRNTKQPSCSKYSAPGQDDGSGYRHKAVYLGLIDYQARKTKPALVASYDKPLDVKTSWDSSSLSGPDGKSTDPDTDDSGLMPDEYIRFDFAPFKITDTNTAIGVRFGWHEGYAGGGEYSEALALFKINGSRLLNVLTEPVYYYQNLAGNWNRDGTRQHDVFEGRNVLSFLLDRTAGHYDIKIKSVDSNWAQVFKWDNEANRYRPVAARSSRKLPKSQESGRTAKPLATH